jgi:hypothetical protein
VKTEDFDVSSSYSDIWSVWFSGTVIVGCGGDLKVANISVSNPKPRRETF